MFHCWCEKLVLFYTNIMDQYIIFISCYEVLLDTSIPFTKALCAYFCTRLNIKHCFEHWAQNKVVCFENALSHMMSVGISIIHDFWVTDQSLSYSFFCHLFESSWEGFKKYNRLNLGTFPNPWWDLPPSIFGTA